MNKEDLLKKWLNNELSAAEEEVFSQQEDYALHQSIIDNAKHFKASHFSKINSFKEVELTHKKKKQSKQKVYWLQPMLRIASVFVIAFGIYFSFFFNNATQVQTQICQKLTIELPDHSEVALNADTQIEYNKGSWEDKRSLSLDGEAFFKVAKGEVFDVITEQGIVTVVGTAFNVKQRDDFFEVQCYEGIVKVTSNEIVKQLEAGDVFRMLNNNIQQDKTEFISPQWMQGRSTFKAIPLKEVIAEMERQYNVKILFDNVDTSRQFTGSFTHKSVKNALISVTQPMDLNFKTNKSNQVVIYGNKE